MQKYILILVCLLSTSAPAYALIEITGIKGAILDTGSPTLGGVSCVGSIDLTAEGNAGPFTFQWSNGEETEDLKDLCPGGYSVTVTNRFGCSFVRQAIVPLCLRALSDTEITESSIIQQSSMSPYKGGVDITVNTPATAPLYYKWTRQSDGIVVGTTEDLLNVDPGTYCVEVSSPCGNTVSECYTIQGCAYAGPGGAFQLSYAMTKPCPNGSNGSIEVIVGGSVQGPFSYLWSNGEFVKKYISHLSPGSFTIRITDANGCNYSERVELKPVIEQVSLLPHHNGCGTQGVNSGSIEAKVIPAGNYTYLWSTGTTTQTITGLAAGNYCVTVTDPISGCTATKCQEISQGLPAEAVTISQLRHVDCRNNNCIGSATALVNTTMITGMQDPYTAYIYEWGMAGSSATTFTTNSTISNLCKGNYNVTVSDLQMCTVVHSFCIGCCEGEDETACFDIVKRLFFIEGATITAPEVSNNYLGSIQVNVVDYDEAPNPVLYYHWQKEGDDDFEANTPTINNLTAGTYCVTVTNGCGDQETGCWHIENSLQEIVTTPSCIGGNNGKIKIKFLEDMARTIRVDWATGSASIALSGLWGSEYEIKDLAPGNYTVTVTDGNNLQTTFTSVIIEDGNSIYSYSWPLNQYVWSEPFEGYCSDPVLGFTKRKIKFKKSLEIDPDPNGSTGNTILGIDWNDGQSYSSVIIDPEGNVSVSGPDDVVVPAGQSMNVTLFDNSGCRVEDCWEFPRETSGIVGGVVEIVTLPGTGVTVNAYTQCTTCEQDCAQQCDKRTDCDGSIESNRFTYIPTTPALPCNGGTFYFHCEGTNSSSTTTLTPYHQGQEFIDFSTFESVGEGICRYPAGCLFEVTDFMPDGYFNPDIPVYVNTYADLPSTACNVPPGGTGGGGTDVPCDGLKEMELTDPQSCTGVVICIGLDGFSVETDFQFNTMECYRINRNTGICSISKYCLFEGAEIFMSSRDAVDDECEILPECTEPRPSADRSSEEVDTKLVKEDDFEFFPNPFNQSLLLRYEAFEAGNLMLQLHDIAGHVFFTQVLSATAGSNFFKIETDKNLPEGFYFVTLQSPNKQVATRKIIKMGN